MSDASWSARTAPERLERTVERLEDGGADTASIFTGVFAAAARADAAKLAERAGSPLCGALVSIKALLDVAGEITHGGTRFLADAEPAATDAPAVARLRKAGAVIVGHTNMSELAYSGLGLNPHHGTPDNPRWPGHTPGGSSSGGAVSVARGLVDIAIGSDTGGSLRIPAAFCGITGFKPTQASVPRGGTLALSDSLDTIGPMARDVAGCGAAWRAMARRIAPESADPLALHIAPNFGFDDMDPVIAEGFDAALERLARAGIGASRGDLALLESRSEIPPWHLTAVECRAHYEPWFQAERSRFDPRVQSRMARADELSAIDYRRTLNRRTCFADALAATLSGRALVLPTTPILPPSITELADDARFAERNLLALRNPTLANIGDCCSIALPFDAKGLRLSLMLIGGRGADEALLATAQQIEAALAAA